MIALRPLGYFSNSFLYALCLPIAQTVICANPTTVNENATVHRVTVHLAHGQLTRQRLCHHRESQPGHRLVRVVRTRDERVELSERVRRWHRDHARLRAGRAEVAEENVNGEVARFGELGGRILRKKEKRTAKRPAPMATWT